VKIEFILKKPTFFFNFVDDDDVRIVRSHKDRFYHNMDQLSQKIKNSIRINDWSDVQTQFNNLQKEVGKSQKIIEQSGKLPSSFYASLISIQEGIRELTSQKSKVKAMNKPNTRAYNQMVREMKRQVGEHSRGMESLQKQVILLFKTSILLFFLSHLNPRSLRRKIAVIVVMMTPVMRAIQTNQIQRRKERVMVK